MAKAIKILAVDDETYNLDIITFFLQKAGYEVVTAIDGVNALEQLEVYPDVSAIVLDRMMPRMDGMEVMKRIKKDAKFKDLPVIMQTAAAASDQVLQGIQAGVYYYLTKPYDENMLLSILRAALKDLDARREVLDEVAKCHKVFGLMHEAEFRFRTLEEAKNLSYYIASCYPDPERVVYGLGELMVNAVEHGNLGITYAQKTDLVLSGGWEEEVKKRVASPQYADKFATIIFSATQEYIQICIKDQGMGFDWQNYLSISPSRATDPNGRGVAMAKELSFPSIQYIGCGNEVICIFPLKADAASDAA